MPRRGRPSREGRRAFLATLLLALGPGPARGEADGGASSVFAFGAGNRALALGGAFTAVVDDASAPVWNPAGLGLLQRTEFVASQARLYGLDISEQFASLALPIWSWGTGALVFRRFAVGGIERRSDRNVLLDDDLHDSQTELALSYGRALDEAWSIGGSVKMHRQSLAGFHDLGIGADLGVLVRPALAAGRESPWASRLTLGVAVRNALEPSLRLDRDDVPDPTSLRTGLAYRHPCLGQGSILGSVDVVKTKKSDTALRLGLEAVPHPVLALRAGWNDGDFTAGAGIRWRLYSFDYVLEDNTIETVHRFGVTVAFGPTVTERHAAARRREEEAFRERLAASFEQRRTERVRDLLAQGESLLGAGEIERALGVVATVSALDPENAAAKSLECRSLVAGAARREADGRFAEAAILYGRALAVDDRDTRASAGLERCRSESDRRAERTARIRDLFAAALDAFGAGDLRTARDRLQEILRLAPDDTDAKAMLARSESGIRARTADLLARAGRYLDRGLLEKAEAMLRQARNLDPVAEGLGEVAARLRKAEEERSAGARADRPATEATPSAGTAPAALAPRPPALSKKKRKEIADLYERGIAAMENERADDALHYWELVWLADPEYLSVADFLKREYLLRGLDSFSRGDLEDAVRLWEKALSVDPEDDRTIGYLERAREQQTRTREILGPRTPGARP